MAKNFMTQLAKLDGALVERRNVFAQVVRSSSPSFNFIFGKAHGLPRGYSCVLWGAAKCGKSTTANDIIGQTHKDYPDGYVVKFDTEGRDEAQLTPSAMAKFGIDPDRYMTISSNSPDHIFDALEQKISALCDDGMDLPLVVIDSLSAIQGRRALNAKGVMQQQIGDRAQTIGDGLKRILAMQRKHRFAMLLLDHARVEMDEWERLRNGHQWKMASASAAQHYAEFFVFLESWKSKEGKKDLLGNDLVDDTVTDLKDKPQEIGHKVRAKMVGSTLGPKGRTAVFTLRDDQGIINQYEEVFQLGTNRNIIDVTGRTYAYGNKKWVGKEATVHALRDDPEMCSAILSDLRLKDGQGMFSALDWQAEQKMAEGKDDE